MLQSHVIRTKERRSHLSKVGDQILSKQIGRNMEVYVDDMLIKSREARTHLVNLQEAFDTLKRYKMKLNPVKFLFGVSSRKFLGFLVS